MVIPQLALTADLVYLIALAGATAVTCWVIFEFGDWVEGLFGL